MNEPQYPPQRGCRKREASLPGGIGLNTKKRSRTSFGATAPPFIDYLQDILRRYPDGGQILKELIQNADDAKATEVVFIHDDRSYGTERLWTDELGKYQGSALYAYNNAAFTDEDWEGIQKAGRSVKCNDPNKVGRFGIGFNSVYHITDVPSIFSSNHLGMMDPQEKIFGQRNSGFLWSLDDTKHQEALIEMHDQFQPFRDIVSLVGRKEWSTVINEDQHFDGTIFRFPLRKEVSDISDNLYDSDRVVELFDSFIADADLSLLFLKNVTSVSLIHINIDGTVKPRLEVKSSISTDVVLESEDDSIIESSTRFKVITLNSEDHKETKWLLTTCTMKEGNVEHLDSLAKKVSFFPQVDLAFPCGEKRDSSESRLSCFLPLPNNESNKTGLPVYINACFGLTDNRREIKWKEEDQQHDEHAVWNELLMKEVLPQAYIMIIQDAIKLAQQDNLPVSSVYDLWPDIAQIKHKRKWYAVALDVLDHLFRQNLAVLSLAKDEREFITPSEAVFPCNAPTSSDILASIKRTLVSCGENLVTLPGSVASAINVAYPNLDTLKHVTPAFIRGSLRRNDVHTISKHDKLCLLEFILSDEKYRELEGLQLLPLNDGSFRSFTDREEDTALIDSNEFPRVLLPFCKHLFIPDDLRPACSAHLKELARENIFKVINIDAKRVAEYTKRFLPQDWKQMSKGHVTWDVSSNQHPPLEWLQEFWTFLNTHFKELSNFIGLPLIPVSPLSVSQPVSLAILEQKTTLIFQKRKQMTLPEKITELVNKLGGTVVRENDWLKHEDLDTYVLGPSPRSVMKLLVNLDSHNLIRDLKTASHGAREELKDYLSRLDCLAVTEKDLLSKLPLFQTMNGSCVAAQSKQAVLLMSGLKVPTDFPMPDSVVRCATEADRRLLQLLKVQLLDTAEAAHLLIDCIESRACRREDTEKIMTWILQHGAILFSQNQTLKHRCKDLSFIEVNGELKKPSAFFDPRIKTFKVIFESDFFPPPLYTGTSQMLQSLTDLGLLNQEVDVSPEHFVHAATLIDKAHVDSQTEALNRAQVLLKMLDTNDLFKFSPEQLHCINMLKWIPCTKPGNDKTYGNDTSQRSCFFCPDETRHSDYADIVEHVMPLGTFSDRVSSQLGLKRLPPPEKVIENLSALTSKAQKMTDPDTNVDFKRKLHSIYKHMQDHINEFSRKMKKDTHWLWSHDQFVSPQDLVLDYPRNLDLSSYIRKVPNEFLPYKKLLQEFGLKTITTSRFLTVLQEIHSQHGNKTLPKKDLLICLTILRGIYEAKDETTNCLIPNEHDVLQPASEMFFNDSPWRAVDPGVTLCHKDIQRAMACHFGIKTTRHDTLQNYTVENISPFTFHFEQQEQLTVRIKNIISAYPSKKDILKELIQNADDAEATEIHFVWDKRQHGTEKTFGEKWNELQGPALCVFNNKVFSDDDLKGIQQLGEGGKRNSPGKTGKYGVGFNSVYHLTDCPSILTGDKLLCISDPNKKFIDGHSDKPPAGTGYKLADTFKNMYMDVYKSFLPDKFPLKDGTMFRLPLRIGTMANSSKISLQEVTDHDMNELCSALSEDPEGLILFLKNICKIEVHEIDEHSGILETIFMVEKGLPQISRESKDAFVKLQQSALQSDKPITPDKAIYSALISTSDKRQSKWIIAEQFGTFKNSGKGDQTLPKKLPQAAIAALVSSKFSGEAPPSNMCGQAFCSLPLPGTTGLPVHVNANFEVDSARRGLWKEDGQSLKSNWNESLKQNLIAPLYADLLQYICHHFAKKKTTYASLESFYLCFWPNVSKHVGQDWHEMIHEVYRSIKEKGLDVIPVLRSSTRNVAGRELKTTFCHWCNVRENETTKAPYLTDSETDRIMPILEDLGMTLVPSLMQNVWESFRSAGIAVRDVNPSSVQTFLREIPVNDPTRTDKDLPLPITATLIRDGKRCSELLSFCLKDFKKTAEDNSITLNGLPLLLTSDNVLRVFDSKSPKLISSYQSLFSADKEQFADFQTNGENIDALRTLNLVKRLTVPCAAKYLKPLIQQLLQKCEVDPQSGLHVPNKRMLKWLKPLWKFFTSEIKPAPSNGDEESLTLSDVRQLFSDCCILPVVCPRLNNKHFLKTMKDMPSVLNSTSGEDISGILFKLGFMALESTEMHVDQRLLLYSELMDVNDKSSVLEQLYNITHSEFSQLSNKDLKELQCDLQSGVSKSKDKQEYQRKLKSLPIFETIHGERVRIDGPKEVFILNSTYSKTFPDLFSLSDSNSIFLKYSHANISLAETLKIQIMTDLKYFMKFILPVVHTLTGMQKLHCLKLLLTPQFIHCECRETIISSMKTVQLIANYQGTLEKASYFFDENVELYKKMLPKERFVPERFWTELCEGLFLPDPKKLLRDLGMKHVVSKDDIIHFAHQLESEAKGNGDLKDLEPKSSLIFKAALNIQIKDKHEKEMFLEEMADIKFIFPVKIKEELQNYHQPFVAETTAVKIRGSLIDTEAKHQELIWSSMPIIHLPVYKSKEVLEKMNKAGAHEQPPPNCVISNMRNICQSPCKDQKLIKTRAEVFRSAYTYLQVNTFEVQTLAGLPVVLVEKDKELAKPDDTSFSLPHEREFRPYLYKVSPNDVMFSKFFKQIGVKDKPTAVQYCNVLAAVYADSCEKPHLNPNQQKTVKRAVEQFFLLIKTEENQSLVDNSMTLYLPAVDGKVYPSCKLYYNDTVFESKRLEKALDNKFLLLEKLSECHLGNDVYEHHRLLRLLPQTFKPNMLSQFTEEKVVESDMQLCELGADCEFSGWFDRHLSSEAFIHGLICLIRDQSKGEITQDDATEMCKKTFGSIQIVCCNSLKTELWVNQQPLHQTASQTDVFVKQEQQGCIFYLKHNNNTIQRVISDINMTLTKEINALLGNILESKQLLVLAHLLTCDNMQDVLETLAKNGILDSAETQSIFHNQPAPGTEIPVEWHDSLDMNILNNFEEGEYVGYSTNNKYIYAVIVEELPGQSGPYSHRYKIEIGEDEPIEVSCLDLYQFKRQNKPEPKGSSAASTSADTSCMDMVPLEGAVPHSSKPSTTSSSSTRSSPASLEEAKMEIDKCLKEIWTLPEEEKLKAIKRLYLRWHPDKNLDCIDLATEAFKYLQNQIAELSKGKGKGQNTGSSYSSGRSDFRNFYDEWNQEARHHRNARGGFSRRNRSYNFWTHNENVPRPNKEEAQRWRRQARCDLDAAYKDVSGASTEWCLFKVHQAVEKSLTAAKYKRDGQHPTSSSILSLAAQVSLYNLKLRVLPQIVRNLKALGVDDKNTQYPNCHPFPHIPNEQFKPENALLALESASELLSLVKEYVN
ncbi:sacsin-like [Gymnodraco acuticeps]|uniref:Sacsin-like n=1 Tax=Gymnodraco acuticeps TaxID=8218 RepID=A0A6P8T869_GYMAC|nr:sacsin-like [Gymnodraco acuticeps]